MSRPFKPGLAFLLILTVALTSLTACQPSPIPSAENPTPAFTQSAKPPGPSSLTVSATGGDLEDHDTQAALLSIINWKSLSEEVLSPETDLVVLLKGEVLAQPADLASDPETLHTLLVDSQTGAAMSVSLLYPEGDDELLLAAVSIARNLKAFGVKSSLYPVDADRLQSSVDTHTAAEEEVLVLSR